MNTPRRPRFAVILLLAATLPGLHAQRADLLSGPGFDFTRSGVTPGPTSRVTSFGTVGGPSPQGGRLFHVQAEVPPHQLAAVERCTPSGQWVPAEDEVFSVDGTAEFHVWADDPNGMFRVKTRPFPEPGLTSDGALQLSEPFRDDLLSLFLRTDRGMRINPPPARQAPDWLGDSGAVPLEQLGVFGVLNGDDPATATGDTSSLSALQQLYARPSLSLIHPGHEELTSASAFYGESLKVPLAWHVSRPGVKRARYVIQRIPFSDPSSYAPPAAKSVVGWVENSWYPDNSAQVSFWLDFAKQGIYGIEPPQPFFVRLYEEDADGNIIGWPSNTFSFVVREPETQWPVPEGELQLRLKRIKCYHTTAGPGGDDEIHWVVLRFRFQPDKVLVDEVSTGMHSFGDGDAHWPNHHLWQWTGPSTFPDASNTWYVLCMREYDSHVTPNPTFYADNLQDMAYLATGAWNYGLSQPAVIQLVRDDFASFKWWFSHIGSDKIGHWAFRLNTQMMAHAVAHGRKRKPITMSGSGSSYGAWFDLDFYPW